MPDPNDPKCVNRVWMRCARKVYYATKKIARDGASRMNKKFGNTQKPYKCHDCGGYHLTTEER